ncbi:tetratricopeptide repeat-containing sensor histidine kinase [Mucilaginibacter sp. 21P]|uniref:tetratricopeptide repeat-containing sensor histidine kinase n=1 Tax=Mucilaginibacter sp. 21P TaxID=2778902 RepID=UPI001C58644F|nr:tetratricopeptide repeat-containing sensor histidine kinase [Mucilaginibacter sp. 21P]QXV64905.1 tetratricopeptide repeat-containing sensor histidine kinase [Mucilaginibacter sp. 21P]
MKNLSLFIVFCLISGHCFAGKHDGEIDSLRLLLRQSTKPAGLSDSVNINRTIELADEFYESAPDSSTFYAKVALANSQKINYIKGIAAGNRVLGLVNSFKGNYSVAKLNYQQSLAYYTKAKDELGVSDALIGLGRVEDFLGNYDSAIKYYNQSLAIRKKLNNQIKIADSYAMLGITYDNKGDLTKALENYFESLSIDLKLDNQLSAADNYCNIGVVMQHLELYPKALEYFNKANKLWLRLDDKQGISTAYQNIGEVLLAQKKYTEAYPYFAKASALYHQLGDEEGIGLIYYNIGIYNYYTGKPDSAAFYLNKSIVSSKKSGITYNLANAYISMALVKNLEKNFADAYKYALLAKQSADKIKSLNLRADATLQLSNALAGLNRFKEAYETHSSYLLMHDSLKNDESVQKLASYNQAMQFEDSQRKMARKEAMLIDKLSQQQRTNIIYGIIIVVMTTVLVFYYNAKRKQLKANALLAEKNKEVLEQADKLNDLNHLKDRLIAILAHDLRAPLSTLRSAFSLLISKDVSDEEFVQMVPVVFKKLEHTSDFLDTLLFWINSQVDDINETVRSFCLCEVIKEELELLDDQFRKKNITYVNAVDKGHVVLADPKSIRIVVHNLLTNAIKFSHPDSAIEINAKQVPDCIELIIKDHGVGMSTEQLNRLFAGKVSSQAGTLNEVGTGMGLIFCKDLVEKYRGSIKATSIAGQGSEFSFTLPKDNEIKLQA